jgi:hypothetical protein
MARRLPSIACAVLAVALGLWFRTIFVGFMGFGPADLSAFEAREYGIDLPDWYGSHPYLLAWSRGDGQAFVTLAGDPWARGPAAEFEPALYRYSRVGYAWAGRLAALGRVDLVPIGLLVVSVASLAAIGWTAGGRLATWGPRSVVLAIVPAALVATAASTAEAFAAALAVAATLSSGAIGVSAAAVLGLVRPDFGSVVLLRGKPGLWRAAACLAGAIGVRVFGGAVLGLSGGGLDDNLTIPVAGYLDVLRDQHPVGQAVTVGILATAAATLLRSITQRSMWSRTAFLVTGLFVLCFSAKVLSDPLNSLRASGGLVLVWALQAEAGVHSIGQPREPPPVGI